MNKINITEVEIIQNFTKEIVAPNIGKIFCKEKYVNGDLWSQVFWPAESFHKGYDPEKMRFYYFGKKLNLKEAKEKYWSQNQKEIDDYFKETLIHGLETFTEFENLYCLWLSMDGNIYSITEKYALSVPRTIEVPGKYYDLEKVRKYLASFKRVSNVHIVDDYYAAFEITSKKSLYFDYTPSKETIKKLSKLKETSKDDFIKKKLGLEQFKIISSNELKLEEGYYETK